MVLDDNDAFATLTKAAAEQDPDKIAQVSINDSVLTRWKSFTSGVSTPQLLVKVMTNAKNTGNAAKTLHAIIKQLTKKTTPIDETDGEVINMRMETIAAMIKVGVDPSDHVVEPKCDAEMAGTVDTATMRVTTTRFRCESPIPRLCTLGITITRAGEKYQRH